MLARASLAFALGVLTEGRDVLLDRAVDHLGLHFGGHVSSGTAVGRFGSGSATPGKGEHDAGKGGDQGALRCAPRR